MTHYLADLDTSSIHNSLNDSMTVPNSQGVSVVVAPRLKECVLEGTGNCHELASLSNDLPACLQKNLCYTIAH